MTIRQSPHISQPPHLLSLTDNNITVLRLTEAERHQLLVEFNRTQTDFSHDRCIHQLFEAQAAQTPEATAVIHPLANGQSNKITYHELNGRANQVAHYLRGRGVGPEVLVGICLERSVDMIVALLGVLKAGGAYVPLDPEYPLERLAFMLGDAQVAVLLTQTSLMARLPAQNIPLVCLDSDWAVISQENQQNPSSGVKPDNLAYVIYTSGSTGQPKGVMIQHNSLVNYTEAANEAYQLGPDDRILQFASISWDTSVEEIYSCLTRGATLVLRTPDMIDSITMFHRKCQEWGLTVLNLPTAYWHELILQLGNADSLAFPPPLRLVIIGGEKALPARLKGWFKWVRPEVSLVNTYGLTEVTAVATLGNLSELDQLGTEVPIGRPLQNVQIYLLDQDLQPVPVGEAGELYIGGLGVARGYLNRPELTVERFITHPFVNDKDEERMAEEHNFIPLCAHPRHPSALRLYQTGDLARYRPDGVLEFLGRRDHQVKLRGYRIELGEIEAVLRQHPSVGEAVVILREDKSGYKQLAAFIVISSQNRPQISELRSFLAEKLPEYMLPVVIVPLEALPLTPNGKIDRQKLLQPERIRVEDGSDNPHYPIETVITNIWSEVLGLEQIGPHDNFFELGGHSLAATQVTARLAQLLQRDFSIRTLFEIPTVANLAKYIETLDGKGRHATEFARVAISQDGPIPLSLSQEGLWLHDQLRPATAVYNMPFAVRLQGPFNVITLEQSLNEIVRRHATLRTTFRLVEGRPAQFVALTQPHILTLVNLSTLPQGEREAEALRLAQAEAQQPFDLAHGPLLRVLLLQLNLEEHLLVLTMHHVISDEWSLEVLLRELTILYRSFAVGEASPLPEVSLQYADFAHWQRQLLQESTLASQLSYWKQQLSGPLPIPDLPTDRPRPPIATIRGATRSLLLPSALSQKLQIFSQQAEVTLFMTLLAAFQTLLYRYTGQTDVAVGSPIAYRTRPEFEALIGFFVNTLVMRTNLAGDPTFRELVSRVREVALEAYNCQDLPFELLVRALQPERDLSRNPLFQVMFTFQNEMPVSALDLPNLTITPVEIDTGTSVFDLTLFVQETAQGLKIAAEYSADLFDEATIERLLGHYQTLLAGVAVNPEQRLSWLPLLTEAEQRQLLLEWNETQADYPDACWHELFEAQAIRTPEATAVIFEAERLTYRELNERANQLAHFLREMGVGPNTLVGLGTERSLEMMVGLLGILKAGGAYVPLDLDYPRERLAFILKDAQLTILLTQHHLVERLPEAGAQIICLDTGWFRIAQGRVDTPISGVTLDNLAYVIYTSGSTGQPKGVMIPHRGLANYLVWCVRAYEVAAGNGAPVHSSFSFDLTITGLLAPLLVGRPVQLLSNELEVQALSTALQAGNNYSLVKLTPAHLELLRHLLPASQAAGCTHKFVIGGEALQAESLTFWRQAAPETVLIDEYGPTETVVGSCIYQIPPDYPGSGFIPIGRPIANTQLYLLDEHLQPVPIGVSGELYIGGAGLAQGYLNRPDLTAEHFIPHPFATKPGARLYKTGDLVRYRPDGNLEFIGRRDQQIKLRGYRIELGEIEAVLRHHPAVREAVVIAREDNLGDKRLLAYVVAESTVGLRDFLEGKLPEFMLPAALICLEALPLTPNGKVDRLALPVPPPTEREPNGTAFAAPRDALEQQLVEIWEQVLGVKPIGVHDNFFELGGHSLLAVSLFTQIEQVLSQKLPVATLFQASTVGQLAEALRQKNKAIGKSSLVAIQPRGSSPPFFCAHGMGGGVLDYDDLARYLGPNQPFYGVQEHDLAEAEKPFTQIEAMAAHYVAEIRTLQPQGPYFLGGYCFGGTIAFEMAQQLHGQGQQVALLAIIDNDAPHFEATRWDSGYPFHFLKNLPYWLADFWHLSPVRRSARLRRQVSLLRQKIARRIYRPQRESIWADIEAAIDNDRKDIPESYQKIVETHYLALKSYQPQVYQGRITLFRTGRNSLFGPFTVDMGWEQLATGGVDIKQISGFHEDLLQEPAVQLLAEQLKSCLDQAQVKSY